MKKIASMLCVFLLGYEANGLNEIVIDNNYIDTHAVGGRLELNTDKEVALRDVIYRTNMDFQITCAAFCSSAPFSGRNVTINTNNGNIIIYDRIITMGEVVLKASDSVIDAYIIEAHDGISIFANDLLWASVMQSEAGDIELNIRRNLWKIGGREGLTEGHNLVEHYAERYEIPRCLYMYGRIVIPRLLGITIPVTFVELSLENIVANTRNGVCNIVTPADVFMSNELQCPEVAFNITCGSFLNAAHLRCLSMKVSATNGNLVNTGTIVTTAGDIDLRSAGTLVNSSCMDSFGNIKLEANRIFGFGSVLSKQNIVFEGNDSIFTFGAMIKAEKNISVICQGNIYDGPIANFY